ncbi:MAG: hypothetical protein K2X39_00465 [Silvanigrellaceae bacterium]|nr:hypothetical protein [Silvanigrellaceae bacterium]
MVLEHKLPLSSLSNTQTFVTCHLDSPHEGPWEWLSDSQGNKITGSWSKNPGSNTWTFATTANPISLKSRCAEILLNKHPERNKISPEKVIVLASTRLSVNAISYYVRVGDQGYSLESIIK